MSAPLNTDTWKRRGISVLWDGDTLAEMKAAEQVISLRQFVALAAKDWPEDETPLIQDTTLIVAGLDVAADAMLPEDAEKWLKTTVFNMIDDYQNLGDGGLVFWMPEHGRWDHDESVSSWLWHLTGKYNGKTLPMGQCIWNGAESDVQRIEVDGRWQGLFLERIS
jgi:hypothetical protein